MPTLGQVKSLLSNYIGVGNVANDRINLVRARLYSRGNWKGLKQQIPLTIYSDFAGYSIVTLGWGYGTILQAVTYPTGNCGGVPLDIRNEFTQSNPSGLGLSCVNDFEQVPGYYCVFQDWITPMQLRFKFEESGSSGVIHIRGKYNGDDVYSLFSSSWINGEKLTISGNMNLTTTKLFDAVGLSIVKPVTNGRVSMYTVDSDAVETLVGVYAPAETVPRWKRYHCPALEDVSAIADTGSGGTGGGGLPASQYFTKEEQLALVSGSSTTHISAAGSHDFAFEPYTKRVATLIATGSGYDHNILLDNANPMEGAILYVPMEIAQAAGIVINFYDNVVSGTSLLTVTSDAFAPYYATAVFTFNNGIWRWLGFETN